MPPPPSHPGWNNIISHGRYRARYIRSFVAHVPISRYPYIPPRIINVFVMRIYYLPLLCFEIFHTSAHRIAAWFMWVRMSISWLFDCTSPRTSRLGKRLNILWNVRRETFFMGPPNRANFNNILYHIIVCYLTTISRRKYFKYWYGCGTTDSHVGNEFSHVTRISEAFSTSATRRVLYFTRISLAWFGGGGI